MHTSDLIDQRNSLFRMSLFVQHFRFHQQHIGVTHQRNVDSAVVVGQPFEIGRHEFAKSRTWGSKPVVIVLSINPSVTIVIIIAFEEQRFIQTRVITSGSSDFSFFHKSIHQYVAGKNLVPSLQFRHSYPTMKLSAVIGDRKSTRLNSSHANISYAVFCLKKKKKQTFVAFLWRVHNTS